MKKLSLFLFLALLLFSARAEAKKADILNNPDKIQPSVSDTATAKLKLSSRLFKTKEDLESVIMIIPSGSSVKVLGSDSTYFKVLYEGNEGYIMKDHAAIDTKPVTAKAAPQTPLVVQPAPAPKQEPNDRYDYLTNKYGQKVANGLIQGKIWKGMSTDMVSDSWGDPLKVNKVVKNSKVMEEWIYQNTWLYFENNILLEWGPSKKQ